MSMATEIELLPGGVELGVGEDLAYFQEKLDKETDPTKRKKLENQIAALDDACAVYRLTCPHGPREEAQWLPRHG